MSDRQEKQLAKYKSKSFMGYIQDKVDVGMTKLRSDEGVKLDIAILKATLQDEVVPKEKHVVTLKAGCAASAPRQQVNYVIHGLAKRLEDKPGWLVTLKTLIVFHRLMREVDASFQEELIKYQERTGNHRMLRLEGFADHTTKDTWDYSAWIRVYSVYLDERLGVFKSMRFDPELESTGGQVGGDHARDTKLKSCPAGELLDKLPQVQKLLNRLIACVPEGASQDNPIILQSCIMVLRELRSTYHVVCEGVINLADKFFEMERADAVRGLDIYKDNVALNDKLNAFFSAINNVPALRGVVQMPSLQPLPADFLTTMEEYVRDAPKLVDANAPASARGMGGTTGGQPPAALRTSTMIRAGGTTSPAMAGTTAGGTPGPGGVLKIGPPTGDPAPTSPVAPAPARVEVDLLGDDFSSPPPAGQPTPTSPGAGGNAFGDSAFPAATGGAAAPAPGAMPGQQPGPGMPPGPGGYPSPGMNPFGGASPGQQLPPGAPQGYNSPPQAYGQPNPFGPPGAAPPPNPFGPPGYAPQPTGYGYGPQPTGYVPQPTGMYGAPPGYAPQPTGMYGPPMGGMHMGAPPGMAPNPFGGAPAGMGAPVWGAGPPQGASTWGTNVVPGTATLKRSVDPLNEIGADLFGKNNQPPPQQSLRDMKQH